MVRNNKCMVCGFEFESDDGDKLEKCPKCGKRFVELVDGPPLTKFHSAAVPEKKHGAK